MNIVLLSGGSGKRLWPLSNDIRSKQFLQIFRREDGTYESMVQRMVRGLREADPAARITFATSVKQVSSLKHQLGDDVDVSVEPARRDTFPAIALATAYLKDVRGISGDDTVVVCPVDPFVDASYFSALKELDALAKKGTANLCVMGMEPTYPSEKYGYILPAEGEGSDGQVFRVGTFREKPDARTAASYIEQGALWNGGVFAYRTDYVLDRTRELTGYAGYDALRAHYEELEKISFDYAVCEKETEIAALRFHGTWKDLGTWNTLTEAMEEAVVGDAVLDDTCENVHVINDLDMPVLCMGLKDVVVSASPDGILVSDLHQSSYIKPYVDKLDEPVMYAEKSWGSYKVIDIGENSLTIKVTLLPGHRMNYHSHGYRDEVWMITSGVGVAVTDGKVRSVKTGDIVQLPVGTKHTLIAETEIQVIEVQTGDVITAEDKIKFPLEL